MMLVNPLFRRCEGYLPPVPQPFSSNWRFAAHANINPPCTFHQSGLRALDCAGFARVGATCCDACSCLQYSQKVQQMVKHANDGGDIKDTCKQCVSNV